MWPRADSPLLHVLAALSLHALAKHQGESFANWLEHIDGSAELPSLTAVCVQALPWHLRYRFDPGGLPAEEIAQLEVICVRWLTLVPPEVFIL